MLRGRRRTSGVLELAIRDRPVSLDQSDASKPIAGARVAIVVGRKNMSRAVDRNALKRIVREAFRARRAELPSRDLLFRLRQRLTGVPQNQWKAGVVEAVNTLLSQAATAPSAGPGGPRRPTDR